jgi:hypothetical protein
LPLRLLNETPEISMDEQSEPVAKKNETSKVKAEPALKADASSTDEASSNNEEKSLAKEPDSEKS